MRILEPLSRDELQRLWRWERHMTRFHAVAMTLLVLCAAAAFLWSDIVWVRRLLLAHRAAARGGCHDTAVAGKVSALRGAAAHQVAPAPAGEVQHVRRCLRASAGG